MQKHTLGHLFYHSRECFWLVLLPPPIEPVENGFAGVGMVHCTNGTNCVFLRTDFLSRADYECLPRPRDMVALKRPAHLANPLAYPWVKLSLDHICSARFEKHNLSECQAFSTGLIWKQHWRRMKFEVGKVGRCGRADVYVRDRDSERLQVQSEVLQP